MKSNISWMIRLGAIIFVTGLILMILSLIVHIDPEAFIDVNDDFQFLFVRLYGIMGVVLFFVGMSLYITGMQDLYFKPLKNLLYPELPQKTPLKYPIRMELQHIECKFCSRNIPVDSNQCPYCGGKQKDSRKISLKNL